MTTSWKSQQGNGEYSLQFETDNKDKYKLVEKAAQMAVDGKTVADIEEIKHGEWIDKYKGKYANPVYICSVCEKSARYKFVYDELDHEREVQDLSPYCPHCGAKMDGGAV